MSRYAQLIQRLGDRQPAAIYMNQNKPRNLSDYQKLFHQLFKLGSAHPELADLPDMRDVRKIQSLEYQIDACRRSRAFFRMDTV